MNKFKKIDMKKKYIEKTIGNQIDFDTDYDCNDKPIEVKVLEDFILEAKIKGATHVKIYGSTGFDDELLDITISPICLSFESDKQLSERLLQEEEISRNNERNNLEARKASYEKLKKEFG